MSITVTGVHIQLSDEVRDYVKGQIEKIKSHFDHITNSKVMLKIDQKNYVAEATVNAPGHADFFAEASSENVYEAVDLLCDKLNRQIMKRKEKIQHPE